MYFPEKRKSFQLDLEDALSPPPISLSAPELSSRCVLPFKALRNAVSSTELLHERAMARFYKAVELKEGQQAQKQKDEKLPQRELNHIPYNSSERDTTEKQPPIPEATKDNKIQTPEIFIKSDSFEDSKPKPITPRQNSDNSDKWQQMSFDEDYTASTVSTDGDYTDEDEEDSLTEDVGREIQLAQEEETYHPRNKTALMQPVHETIDEEEEEVEREPIKPLPLLDPNFVPKPILKKRIPPIPEPAAPTLQVRKVNSDKKFETNSKQEKKPEDLQKTDEKMTLFKKITKQKPFSFPKILNKKDSDKFTKEPIDEKEDKMTKKAESIEDKYGDEGRTVIDYYGNIVKEYGAQKRPTTPLYLNTEELKQVAEQQTNNSTENDKPPEEISTKKKQAKKVTENKGNSVKKKRILPKERQKSQRKEKEIKPESKINQVTSNSTTQKKVVAPPVAKSEDMRVLLKTTERATVVIPIDYKQLEERAKLNVRTAIDYTVDVCLLLLAFWVYFFKDERLAIPFLVLIIYRQLQETILQDIPDWLRRHTPQWLKKKTS